MIVTVYVDETGMDGPRVLLGGFVSRLSGWQGFAGHWDRLLRKEKIPYSHILEMRRGDRPFEGWGDEKIDAFLAKARKLVTKHCDFGLTVAIDRAVHREHYREKMPPKTSAASAYGLCARMFFEKVPEYVEQYLGLRDVRINFVFERHDQHFGDAERIFAAMKAVDPEFARKLGTIIPGEKADHAGLQAADALAFMARRVEKSSEFTAVSRGSNRMPDGRKLSRAICPVFHVDLSEDRMAAFHEVDTEIANRIRYRKRQAKAARRGEASSG